MSKSFSFPNVGTCSKQTNIVLNDDHTIESVEVIGGCNGNLKGISRLLKGMKAEDAIARMEGTTCGPRPTSCPDQIAKNLKKGFGRTVTLPVTEKQKAEHPAESGGMLCFLCVKSYCADKADWRRCVLYSSIEL